MVAPADAATIVTFGDSITDGATSTVDTNSSWPSFLAQRLLANPATAHIAVANHGISGNRLLHKTYNPEAFPGSFFDIKHAAGNAKAFAAMLPEVTLDAGGKLAIVNQTQTHLDHLAVLTAREPAAVLLAEVQHLLHAALPR